MNPSEIDIKRDDPIRWTKNLIVFNIMIFWYDKHLNVLFYIIMKNDILRIMHNEVLVL